MGKWCVRKWLVVLTPVVSISRKIKDNGIDTHKPDIVVYMTLHEIPVLILDELLSDK